MDVSTMDKSVGIGDSAGDIEDGDRGDTVDDGEVVDDGDAVDNGDANDGDSIDNAAFKDGVSERGEERGE